MALELQERLLHVEEYQRMVEVGILTEDDRVELLAGKMIQMSPSGRRHTICINALNTAFAPFYKEVIVSIQNPLQLDELSMPEPDVALVKRIRSGQSLDIPSANSCILVIEVAESSLEKDAQIKSGLYAKSLIPEYWVVDLVNDQVLVFRDPKEGAYQSRQVFTAGDVISFSTLDCSFQVSDFLP